ncbi:hypothetical protein [Microbacterium sp.]|uniref:hypothetical protein n=1 Tax=Microbacterium sp. TaxID=51671 RepID=UPI0039E6D384
MRTTVDLPPAVHRRASEIAAEQHRSLSSVIAELTVRGLSTLGAPTSIVIDSRSGFPVLALGRPITSADVAAALDDE